MAVISLAESGCLYVFNSVSGDLLYKTSVSNYSVVKIAVDASKTKLVVLTKDGKIKVNDFS